MDEIKFFEIMLFIAFIIADALYRGQYGNVLYQFFNLWYNVGSLSEILNIPPRCDEIAAFKNF